MDVSYRVKCGYIVLQEENKSKPHLPVSENLVLFEENAEVNTDVQDNVKLLLKFIDELKEIDKSIMLLYVDDKSYKEIAEITGITESNVSTRISRIKEKLKSNFITVQNNFYGTK